MNTRQEEKLDDLVSKLQETADEGAKVSLGRLIETIGRRSFGPLLLIIGVLGMTPISVVPLAASILALVSLLISGQLLFGRESIWLPPVLGRLTVKADRLRGTADRARKPARIIDRWTRPRLVFLTGSIADRLVALVTAFIALAVPALEIVPFATFVPFLALTLFGLGLVARDGLVILIGLMASASLLGLLVYSLIN